MISKLANNLNRGKMLWNISARSFQCSQIAMKKPSIGDAVTILQSKVSSINQVVS